MSRYLAKKMLFTLQRYEFLSKSQLVQGRVNAEYDVVYLTKVRIFKQITTVIVAQPRRVGMLFTLQRYEFLSKSQLYVMDARKRRDVVYLTKVRIFKQITTNVVINEVTNEMLFTLQRYEFLSKSQPTYEQFIFSKDVVYLTKVRIFKQITTLVELKICLCLMLFTLQRYEFLSKSQHGVDSWLLCK